MDDRRENIMKKRVIRFFHCSIVGLVVLVGLLLWQSRFEKNSCFGRWLEDPCSELWMVYKDLICYCNQLGAFKHGTTVDGRNLANHLGYIKPCG